jgi:AraC family transcriptional activator of mtrCDE
MDVVKHPMQPIPASQLDSLIAALDVNFVRLAECVVSTGWRLSVAATDLPGIHYNLAGMGRLIVGEGSPIPLAPHTLIIIPPGRSFRIEVAAGDGVSGALRTVESRWYEIAPDELRRFVAGDGEHEIIMICGYFRASYGASIDLFANLPTPIVEMFEARDQLDQKLKSALAELMAQEVGSGAMTAALLKQVLVTILRRSLRTNELWAERFTMLRDPRIARALAEMISRPGAPHSVQTLSRTAGLSRSAFMSRFADICGTSPITVLRQLRMRHASVLLADDHLSIDQVADMVGYASRSSFSRAFRRAFGIDPSDYRGTMRRRVNGKHGLATSKV